MLHSYKFYVYYYFKCSQQMLHVWYETDVLFY